MNIGAGPVLLRSRARALSTSVEAGCTVAACTPTACQLLLLRALCRYLGRSGAAFQRRSATAECRDSRAWLGQLVVVMTKVGEVTSVPWTRRR